MALPTLGPPTAPQFSPIPDTPQPAPTQAPADRWAQGSGDGMRMPGSAPNPLLEPGSVKPYEPPDWAKTILVSDPAVMRQAGVASSPSGYTPPGPPDRLSFNAFSPDPVGSFLGQAMGATPGDQRGGSYHGLATAPVTLANFSTWGREGLLALALDLTGSGDSYQQPEGAQFGQQPTGPKDGGGLLDQFVSGARGFGDLVSKVIDAPMQWYRDSNAFNRGKDLRDVAQKGETSGFLIERATSLVFGGQERFTMDGLRRAAAQRGMDVVQTAADLYDISNEQAAAIFANPWMSDQQLGEITNGTPLSKDMLSNLALEGAMLMATMAVGGAGVGRVAAKLGVGAGEGLAGAFGAGLRGGAIAEDAAGVMDAARAAGMVTRRVMQLNSWNTAAGWTIRGAELGIKQLAIIGGNDELTKAMDRLLWTMPLSMNPGWNLIDGFSSHPLDAYRDLRSGQVTIGRPTSPGYVGQLDIKGMALRDAEGRPMTLDLAGRTITLSAKEPERAVIGKLRDMTLDQFHQQFFSNPKIGVSLEKLQNTFGPGNRLTVNDLRNAMFHMALSAVRDAKGEIGRLEGIHLPTYAARTTEFVRKNARGALKMLEGTFDGSRQEMVDLYRGSDIWDLAKRNDTRMGAEKARLDAPYDPALAFSDFVSWIRASKLIKDAISAKVAAPNAVAAYRKTINRDYIAQWLGQLQRDYQPDEVVPNAYVNWLKALGGYVEGRGQGQLLIRGRQLTFTRAQLEGIVADIFRADDEWQRSSNAVPRAEAAVYRKGVDPLQDPQEDARVAGISLTELDQIRRSRQAPPTAFPTPHLLSVVARSLGRTADALRAEGLDGAWKAVNDWLDARTADAAETAHVRDTLDNTAKAYEALAADGRMDPAIAGPAIAALHQIRDELLLPLDENATARRPGLWQSWTATRSEAVALAGELESLLAQPEHRARVATPPTGETLFVPPGVPADVVTGYADLAKRIAAPTNPALTEADRAFLLDPTKHPFEKAEIMRRSVPPDLMRELGRLEMRAGGRPEEIIRTALNDLAGKMPGDPPAEPGAAEAAASGAQRWQAQADELAGRAERLALRFRTMGGRWSDEFADTVDRVSITEPVFKANQPKGRKQSIYQAPMDPGLPERDAAALAASLRRQAEDAVRQAEARVARAQRAVDDPAAIIDPTGQQASEGTWRRVKVVTAKGDWTVKKAEAQRLAAELTRDTGVTHWGRKESGGSRWEVVRLESAPAPRPAPGPISAIPADLTVPELRAYDARYLVDSSGDMNPVLDLPHLDALIARTDDPAYLADLRTYLESEKRKLTDAIAKDPPTAGLTDRRALVIGELDRRLGLLDQRAQRERVQAEPAPLAQEPAPAEPVQAPVQTEPAPVPEAPAAPRAPEPVVIDNADAIAKLDAKIAAIDNETDLTPVHPLTGETLAATNVSKFKKMLRDERRALYQQMTESRAAHDEWVRQNEYAAPAQDAAPAAPVIGDTRSFPEPTSVRPISFQLRAVEASTLVNSWDPGYPQQFQMKVTKRQNLINDVAQKPLPESLLLTESGAEGAPVLLPDGVTVMAGNHRVEGIRLATDAAYARLKNALIDRAPEFGLDQNAVARMDRPVLVRVLTDESQATPTLANALNGYSGGMTPAEYAKTVADTLTPGDWRSFQPGSGTLDDALAQPSNKPFLNRVQQALPESEREKIINANGEVQPYGITIAKAALIGRVLGTTTDPLVGQLANTVGKKATVVNGLLRAMPDLAAVDAKMAEGIRPRVAFQEPLREALRLAMNAPDLEKLASPSEMDQFLAGVFGDTDATTQSLARELIGLVNDLEPQRQAPGVARFLDHLAAVMEELPDPTEPTLFAEAPATTAPFPRIANEAVRRWNEEEAARGGLMGQHQMGLIAESSGIRIARDGAGQETAAIHPVIEDPAPVVDTLVGDPAHLVLEGNGWKDHRARIASGTGPITIRMATTAEADAVRAFLETGDQNAAPPAAYRVVNGVIEPLDNARITRARRLIGDGSFSPAYKDEAMALLDWMEGGEQGPRPAVRKGVADRVARETAKTAPAYDPDLGGLRLDLQNGGREWTVTAMDAPPVAEEGAAPATTVRGRRSQRVDPQQEQVTGVPATDAHDLAAKASADAGEHRIVPPGDEVSTRAELRQANAGGDTGGVIERNRPDPDLRRKLAQEALDREQAALQAAQARLDRLPPPADAAAPAEILRGAELDLYHRYTADPAALNIPTDRQPLTVGEVLSVLESLDLGMPPLAGTMTDAELTQLRGSLYKVLHGRLTELGAPDLPSASTAKRAGIGKAPIGAGVRGVERDAEALLSTPEDYSAQLADVMRQLQGRVYEAADPLAGWEGTQYEIGALPAKGLDGQRLSPRLQYDEWLDRVDELVPSLRDELLYGRKRAWTEREQDARLSQAVARVLPPGGTIRSLMDTAFGARPEKQITREAIGRFEAILLEHFKPRSADDLEAARAQVHKIIGDWHDHMAKQTIAKFQKYRRIGLVPADQLEKVALDSFGADRPQWLNDFLLAESKRGVKQPIAEAWREADNRVRAYLRQRPGGMQQFLDHLYDSGTGQRLHGIARNVTVGYHIGRFLMDLRWLGLETIDAPVLVAGREGIGAMLEGLGRGKDAGKMPLFMDEGMREAMRTNWAWWIANSDAGTMVRTRERYILGLVRRTQEQEYPRAIDAYLRGLERVGEETADLRGAMRAAGDSPMAYVKRLSEDLAFATQRGVELSEADAKRMFSPWLERGTISPSEYADLVKARRYNGHPLIDAELQRLADPRLEPLLQRLAAINQQGWNDAAQLIFGQTDRSNIQRLANHPLLYWPISYQIKATKWLAGLLFDRAFGLDTGSAGAVTLGMLHQMHKDRMQNDPEYATQVSQDPTLLFVAQMLLPIAPWEIGVGLSPFTKMALAALTQDDPTQGYRRNLFAVGPGYTYFQLLPRLFYEQSKAGSWAQSAGGPLAGLATAGQRFFPYSVPVAPKAGSQLDAAAMQTYGNQPLPSVPPPTVPTTRIQ